MFEKNLHYYFRHLQMHFFKKTKKFVILLLKIFETNDYNVIVTIFL